MIVPQLLVAMGVALLLASPHARAQPERHGGCLALPIYLEAPLATAGGVARFDVRLHAWNTSRSAVVTIEELRLGPLSENATEVLNLPGVQIEPLRGRELAHLAPRDAGRRSGLVVVRWSADEPVAPVLEAVMIGSSGARGFALVRQAVDVPC